MKTKLLNLVTGAVLTIPLLIHISAYAEPENEELKLQDPALTADSEGGATIIMMRTNSAGPPIVPMGTCGDVFDVKIDGGEAHWTVNCFGGKVRMSGRVDDTRPDTYCAEVKGVFSDHTETARNCGVFSDPTYFDWSGPGNTVDGYLYLV
jgi:hypothetical protein